MNRFLSACGDVVVELPHTLTAATRSALHARVLAVLPTAASLSRSAPDARLVLDARGCMIVDDAGLTTLWALRRAAAASGAAVIVVDASPALAERLTHGREDPMPLAAREDGPPTQPASDAEGVLRLDDAARARLAARRRR